MILVKDNVKRKLTDAETIKMFLAAGWKEQVAKPPVEKTEKNEEKPKKEEVK